jgi:hypothetical protein
MQSLGTALRPCRKRNKFPHSDQWPQVIADRNQRCFRFSRL